MTPNCGKFDSMYVKSPKQNIKDGASKLKTMSSFKAELKAKPDTKGL